MPTSGSMIGVLIGGARCCCGCWDAWFPNCAWTASVMESRRMAGWPGIPAMFWPIMEVDGGLPGAQGWLASGGEDSDDESRRISRPNTERKEIVLISVWIHATWCFHANHLQLGLLSAASSRGGLLMMYFLASFASYKKRNWTLQKNLQKLQCNWIWFHEQLKLTI